MSDEPDETSDRPEKGAHAVGKKVAKSKPAAPRQQRRLLTDGDEGVSRLIEQVSRLAGKLSPRRVGTMFATRRRTSLGTM